jgi:hypothetical protein
MYRHRLPPGFVLKSDKKKAEEDAKKEKISLEDFLEVEVNPQLHQHMSTTYKIATQAKTPSYPRYTRIFRHLEKDTFGKEGSRTGSYGESKHCPEGCWKTHWSFWSSIVRSWR